jgi:hypothetical protein
MPIFTRIALIERYAFINLKNCPVFQNNNQQPMMMTTAGRQRSKRHAIPPSLSTPSNEDLNDLSYRVLRSIEAAMVAEADSGNCLRRMLCEDNRYSKQANDGRRIWVPVWR